MFSRFSRSWELVKVSMNVLGKDKELLIFPLFSSIAAIAVLASFLPLFALDNAADATAGMVSVDGETSSNSNSTSLIVFCLFYFVEYFVIFFFNTALVGAALIRMDGGDPTVRDGLRIATSKLDKILGYTLIAATVGLVLRAISNRVGMVGQIVVGLLGAGWTVATFLTVPILVSKDIGPIDAVKESATLLKRTWGENLITTSGFGLVFFLIYVALFFVVGSVAYALAGTEEWLITWLVIGVLAFILTGLMHAALQGIFSAALYRYAVDGDVGNDFDRETLSHVFESNGPPKSLAI
jgi:hypothetical protein